MMTKKLLLSAAVLLTAGAPSFAQKVAQDSATAGGNKEVKNRNVMLNASADNQPRAINIGLPQATGATIFEDGLIVSQTPWPLLPYFYWAASPMYSHIGVKSLSENALTGGGVSYAVDSWTRKSGDKLEGHADYVTNNRALQRFDVNILAPLGHGWSIAATGYVNHDPGNNKLADVDLQNKMMQYKFGITKTFKNNRGDLSLFYKHSDYQSRGDGNGPFIFVGDGSVKEYNGFKLGRDGYTPADQQLEVLDIESGKMENVARKSRAMQNEVQLLFNWSFSDRLSLSVSSKYHYNNSNYVVSPAIGMSEATATSGFTYAASNGGHRLGDVHVGPVQMRFIMSEHARERGWLSTAELKGRSMNLRHNWRVGYNLWWVLPTNKTSTSMMSHTVEKDPTWLLINGRKSFSYNTGAEYYDAAELKNAVYASDDWQVTDRLWLSGGIRAEWYKLNNHLFMGWGNTEGTVIEHPENMRSDGWTTLKGTKTDFEHNWLRGAVTLSGRYVFAKGFGVLAEGIFNRESNTASTYTGSFMPNTDAVDTWFGTAGIFWNTPWMKLVSQFSVIKKTNYQENKQFTNPHDGSEVITIPNVYDIQTTGWTTDVVLTPVKGFAFHGLLTLQSPKYKKYNMDLNFADGTKESYNFTDKLTTGVSKVIVELDPSYMFSKFRVWASFRYQSKQYINHTNSLYFNGRWESFAGLDYHLSKNIGFSLNFVNLFNSKGASGSISSADLVTDTTPYKNYLMSGNYIRPFTVEFATHINF